jgi:hypothetical protein
VSGEVNLTEPGFTAELKFVSGGALQVDYIVFASTTGIELKSWGSIKREFKSDQ